MKFIRGIAAAVALFCVLSGVFISDASQASVEWVRPLSAPETAVVLTNARIIRADDGSLFVSGATPQSSGTQRLIVSKFSAAGALQWRTRIPGEAIGQSQQPVTLLGASEVVAVTKDLNGGNAVFTKLDSQGQIAWSRSSFVTAGANAFLVSKNSELYAVTEFQLTRILPSGEFTWQRGLNSPSGSSVRRTALVLANGDVVFQSEYGVRRYAATNGDELAFSTEFGAQALVQTTDGNFVFIQSTQYIPSTATIVYRLRSVSPAGTTRWIQQYGVPTSSIANVRLFADPTGGVYVAHARDLQPYGDVARIDSTGSMLWNRNYFRFYGFAQKSGVLYGLRYDVNSTEGVNGFFPIQSTNGDLGTAGFSTTSNPPHRFDEWTGTANGFAVASTAGIAQRVLEVADSGALLWSQESARVIEETSVDRASCLMPRLALSSPARVAAFAQKGAGSNRQFLIGASNFDGSSPGSTPIDTGHCATAFDNSNGTFRATQAGVRKVDSAGATTWNVSTSSTNVNDFNRIVIATGNGDVLAAGNDKLSRISGTGALRWEIAYNPNNAVSFFSTPKYVAEDASGNAIVSGDINGDPWAIRVSNTGSLLYRQLLGSPACSDYDPRFQATSSGELYVVSSACNEGRVYKYAADGNLLWQRTLSAVFPDLVARLSSVTLSSTGDVYVGGCLFAGYGSESLGSRIFLQSYSSSGSERWNRVVDVLPDAKECVASMTIESSRLIVAVESSRSSRANYLVAVDAASGTELWRSADALSDPAVIPSDMRAAESGRVFVLGDNDRSRQLVQIASLRKVNVSSVSTIKAAFLSLANPSPTFRTAFAVTLGLQTSTGAAHTATQPTQIWLSRGAGTGALSGPTSCTVATGQSSCSISGLAYDRAETGVSLVAEVDGSLPTTSPLFDVARAPTQTTMEVLTAPPYYAFDRIQVRYSVTGVAPIQSNEGYINRSPYAQSCVTLPQLAGFVLREECTIRIRVGEQLSANFYSNSGYAESAATPINLSISPVPLSLQAASVPSPRVVVGTEFLLTAKLLGVRGEDLSSEYEIYVDARDSNGNTVCSLYPNGRPIRSCSTFASLTGVRNYVISVQSSSNIIAPNPANFSVEVIAGLALSGSLSPNGNVNPKFCATATNADCDVSVELNRYFCALPIGWTGSIYPQVDDLTARATPNVISISGEAGSIVRDVYFNSGAACSFDTDANGAIETFSDGLFVLRAMLGMPAAANETLPTNACARRTASDRTSFVGDQIASLKYDIDGNGSVSAATDGLLLMRALLGLRGDAVTAGALGVGATRQNWNAVRDYLAGSCGVGALY
jgi:PQQ-like domain